MRRTVDIGDTVLVTDQPLALARVQSILKDGVETSGLILISLDTVLDLLRGVAEEVVCLAWGSVWVHEQGSTLDGSSSHRSASAWATSPIASSFFFRHSSPCVP